MLCNDVKGLISMFERTAAATGSRVAVAVLCCGRSIDGRGYQMVADRFISPIARASGMAMILPAIPDAVDARQVALRCDALLMTGSCSNVSGSLYGGTSSERPDHGRDTVALAVAEAMIEAGRPVLGICRGMQELNVLFGGTLEDLDPGIHMDGSDWEDPRVLAHRHDVDLSPGGVLSTRVGTTSVSVFSAHRQGISRLASGLSVEAKAHDGLVEAFSCHPRSSVMGVQWHPELSQDAFGQSLFDDLVRAAA